MVRARNLSKMFRRAQALRSVTFEVEPREVFGICGPAGAGKTTLLRILAGGLRPTGGTAAVAGYDVVREREKARRVVGLLAADAPFNAGLAPRALLRRCGRSRGLAGAHLEHRIDELLEQFGAADMRIAAGLLHDPLVLLVDGFLPEWDTLIAAARREGKCVLIAARERERIERLCDRVWELETV